MTARAICHEGKIYGPFWPYNKRGLPIAMRQGIPAWMVAEAEKAARKDTPDD